MPTSIEAAKRTDPNYKAWVREYGDQQPVELDALHPELMTRIITDALENTLDMTTMDEQQKIETRERDILRTMRRSVEDFLGGAVP